MHVSSAASASFPEWLEKTGGVFLMALALLLLFTPGIGMTEDLGRHLLLGEIIVRTHAIPDTNLLTHAWPDFPFINHHWLSEVLFHLVHKIAGLNGLLVAKTVLLALAFGVCLRQSSRRARRSPLFWFAGVCCALLLAFRPHVRPEIFSYLGVAGYGLLLGRIAQNKDGPRWKDWILLCLAGVFWVNAHIYFIFGVGMVGAYVASLWAFHLADWRAQPPPSPPWRESLLLLLLGLAGCANPSGWRGFLYPFRIFANYGIAVTENASPLHLWQTSLNPMLLALPVASLITLYAVVRLARRMRPLAPIHAARAAIALAALAAAWLMARSAPLLALALPPLLADALDAPQAPRPAPSPLRTRLRTASLAAVLLLNLWLAHSVLDGAYHRVFPSPIGPTPFGLDHEPRHLALRRLRDLGLRGPVFNDYNSGSLVEYNLHPIPAYVDNRPEAFPFDFWQQEYLPALADHDRWNQLLEARRFQTLAVSLAGMKEPFARMMMHDPAWQLVHLDFFFGVWVRKSPENEVLLRNATYTYDDLHAYRDDIAERLRTLDGQPFWKRQVAAEQIAYELYSLICIDQPALAWPLVLQLHLRHPDYQIVHELLQACAPPDAQPALLDLLRRAARWPLSAKQVLDYVHACRTRGLHVEADRALRRGRLFFPLNPRLRALSKPPPA
jgi:hypothetical protein